MTIRLTASHAEPGRFLTRYAFGNQQARAAQTWVALHAAEVVGFSSLVVATAPNAMRRARRYAATEPIIGMRAQIGKKSFM